MRTFCGTRAATVVGLAIALITLTAPAIARDLSTRIAGLGGIGTGFANSGSAGAGLQFGAGAGSSSSDGTDLSAAADGQVTASGSGFQNNARTGSAPLGLDRLSVQGDGKANVSIFYKILKSGF
jgi:hypothetical protein